MSNHDNNRRGEKKRTPTGPTWENHGEGDAPHVARARRKWKRVAARTERHSGKTSRKVWKPTRVRPTMEDEA